MFGLPGNPVAALTCSASLRRARDPRALGAAPRSPERIALASAAPTRDAPRALRSGRATPRRCGAYRGRAAHPHGSGDFLALAGTDGFVELPPSAADLPAGFVADFYRW